FFDLNDDVASVIIDGNQVVNASAFSPSVYTGSVTLAPGLHPVRFLFAQGGGGLAALLSYQGPDTGNTTIAVPAATALNTPGLVSFPTANTTLSLGNGAALGSGGAALNGGVVNAGSALTVPNNVTFGGTPFAPVAFTGSNLTLTGLFTLQNNTALSV